VTQGAPGKNGGFIGNVATVIGGQVACAVLALATEICYARLLGPEGRGQISLCLMAIAFGILVGGMGGEGTIILWSADAKRRAKTWLPAVLLWGFLGCMLACTLWSVTYWKFDPAFLRSVSPALALIILLSIPVGVFYDYQLGMLVGEERFGARAAVATFSQAAGLTGFLLLLFVGRTAANAMWGNLLGLLGGMAIAAVVLKGAFRNFWRIDAARESLLPTLSFALRGQFGLVASFFNYRLDVFIVNYFLEATQLGYYALGVVIAEALWQIPSAAALALFPRTARTLEQGATEFTCLIMRQIAIIATAGAIVIGVGTSLFLPLVFGERFRPSIMVVCLLLPGTLALCLGRVAASDLSGRGKSGYSSVFSITALVVTIGLDLLLIPRLGIRGAALASSAAYFTNTALLLSALKYELKVSWGALLVPRVAEFAAYQQAWLRARAWMRPAAAVPSR
jgi:O-antigen/teichoic acid export membrane protein